MADITVNVQSPGSLSVWGQSSWGNGTWNIFNGSTLSSGNATVTAEINTGWGGRSWGINSWGELASTSVELSGISLSSSIGTIDFSGSLQGWGRPSWGTASWGIFGTTLAQGQQLSSSLGTITVDAKVEEGWGRGKWGNRAWGDTYSVELVGQQATISQASVVAKADVSVSVSGQDLLTITQGLNSIQIDGDVFVFASEDQLDTAIGTVPSVTGTALVQPTGQSATGSIGQVLPEPKIPVDVTGISATLSLGNFTLVQTTNESVTTAGLLTGSVGSITPVSTYAVTGQSLASSVGSVTAVGGANVSVTGIGLTANIGSVNVTPWSEINPGVNNVWSEVDKAA